MRKRISQQAAMLTAGVMLSLGVTSTAGAVTIEYDVRNRHVAQSGHTAGFVFTTGGMEHLLVDFTTGDVSLTVDFRDDDTALLSLEGTAVGGADGIDTNLQGFHSVVGTYVFDFEFEVTRESDTRYVVLGNLDNAGTIRSPLNDTEVFNLVSSMPVSFFIEFSEDLSTLTASGWLMAADLGHASTGDFHFIGNERNRFTENPEPSSEIPEPASLLLFGGGLAGLLARKSRQA